MLNRLKDAYQSRKRIPFPGALLFASAVILLISQPACFFSRKSRPEAAITSPVRLVLLPFNTGGNKDLQWASLAAPALMAKAGENAKDLELVPLWQTMPIAINSAGASRTFTSESAANIANWLAAKWCVMGEIVPTKNGVSMVVDFIPARSSLIPFRYIKNGKIDSIGQGFSDAYTQFLRYLVAKPMVPVKNLETMTAVKGLAETLDREYGWSVEAQPGMAQEAASELARSDERLARYLFSPALYPSLSTKKQAN